MSRRDSSKKLTIVEVVIVVLVCLFLLATIPPAFHNTRSIAFRMTCMTNMSTLAKALFIYSSDYDDEYPRAGGGNSRWSPALSNWMADNRFAAYGLDATGGGGQATITSSFYLLVKYAEVTPKSFICSGDSGATEFKPTEYAAGDGELIDFWDFGPVPSKHCSYSYHMPYGLYALTSSCEPGMAVAADWNPWIKSAVVETKDRTLFSSYNPTGSREAVKIGNATAHQKEGQNVLFLDAHVGFEKSPSCGIDNDNIYTFRTPGQDTWIDGYPLPYASEPQDRLDSYLVNEPRDTSDPEIPKTSTRVIDEIVKKLEWGNIVFNTPKSMQLKKTETIELLLSQSLSIQELITQLEESGEIDSNSVKISNQMEARLTGTGFQIEALFPETRAVSSKGVIQWKWFVTPTEHGLQYLHLTLSVVLIDTPYTITTYNRDIEVEISLTQRTSGFFLKNWKWLWAAILVPVAGYLWKRYHKKAKQKAEAV